ncbi:fibrinogen-like protein A [Anopheles aquasalis]|uniref:fibrinogen-like protein A n=1 Tax=Anopheles aquasalis TaxID=42839 RepID=UPI00215AF87E|nr:fibrinogen-like protein A [Anopheles aquasalis]
MKLSICFLLICAALGAGATNKSPEHTDTIQETPTSEANLGQMLNQKQIHSPYKPLKQGWLCFNTLIPDCQTPTSSPAQQPSITTTTPITPSTPTTTQSTTIAPRTTTTITPTIKPIPATTLKPTLPSSCKEISSKTSGVYLISVNNNSAPFNVYCEQEKYEGGWIVMQHRFDGSVDFYRNWTEYRDGFGNLATEFWLGLERIHQLTSARKHELIVEMTDFEGNHGFARYNAFQVGSESEKYELTSLGSYSGTAGDSFSHRNRNKFSTKDRNNEGKSVYHYAVLYKGAWWHGSGAIYSNLNGPYTAKKTSDLKSNWWFRFKTGYNPLAFTRMMIREL